MAVRVEPVDWDDQREALRRVREIVFIDEQRVPRELEWDGEDDQAWHFLARDGEQRPIGCARLLPSGQIGRMAVLPEHRGTGLGLALLNAAIAEARRQGFSRVFLHAQQQAAGFYRQAGFLPVGSEFMEAGIVHQGMELALRGHGESECRQALVDGLAQPSRTLMILSQYLDPVLFDTEPVRAAISRFARSSRFAATRILVADTGVMVSRGHRLLELARRLDSRIEIRKMPEELAPRETTFVTWDDRGYLLLPDFRHYTAVVDHHDPVRASRFGHQFAELWDRSRHDPALRVLKL